MPRALALLLALAACASPEPAPEAPAGPTADERVGGLADPPPGTEAAAVGRHTVYVPAYSQIFYGDGRRTFDLTVTLSVRNTDPRRALTVGAVRYYDGDGALVREFLDAPLRLGPLASTALVVSERDRAGGVGASFLVDWHGEADTAGVAVSAPVVEAVMIGASGTQGISFVSPGRAVSAGGG